KRVYTITGEKVDSARGYEYAIAFDAATGNKIWKTKIDSIFIDIDGWGDGARSTPAINDDHMYCLSGFGKLKALSLIDGKEIWQVDLVIDFGIPVPRWGFSTSPLIMEDVLILELGGKDENAFGAFNPQDGKLLWKVANGQPSYCSPIIANIDGQEQMIFANDNTLFSFNSKGESLWTYSMPIRRPTATPVFIEPNKIFVSAVSATGCFIIEIKENKALETMNNSSMQNHWSSSCYHNGYIYGFNVAALQCISALDGNKKWTKRGYGKGSLIMADDKLIVLSDKGKMVLVEASPEAFVELSSFQALNGKSWTAPSFSNGKVYLRNLTQMACYQLK
ncbi:MAG: PQQ-like beta-propeller repeat protein, partial [Bacteroidetes bacterium]|nr:PQQ-like beta-propeller repeat protein [Bacteroidota bacterium]